jgi:hypothetical protein
MLITGQVSGAISDIALFRTTSGTIINQMHPMYEMRLTDLAVIYAYGPIKKFGSMKSVISRSCPA